MFIQFFVSLSIFCVCFLSLDSFFVIYWHIILLGLFNATSILLERQLWYILTHSLEDMGVHTFLKTIYPKVNVIARLEFELAYYDSTTQRLNHYTSSFFVLA